MSNSFDPDQIFLMGLIWVKAVCKGYQQTMMLDNIYKPYIKQASLKLKGGKTNALDNKSIQR